MSDQQSIQPQMRPQQAFEDWIQIEQMMSDLAVGLTAFGTPPERMDAIARLAVGVEGARKLVEYLLSFPVEQIPLYYVFQELLPIYDRRLPALQQMMQRKMQAGGALHTASWLIELAAPSIDYIVWFMRLVADGKADDVGEGVQFLVEWLTGSREIRRPLTPDTGVGLNDAKSKPER